MTAARGAGAALLALAAGAAVFALSCLVERPGGAAFSFGLVYEASARDPWSFLGLFPHRILLPALAHAAAQLGVGFAAFSHACTALFLAAVFHAARRRGADLAGASLATAAIATTGAVQLYKSHVGYPDPLSFALLVLSVTWLPSTPAFWTCTLLGLLAHEQIAFFLPALLLARVRFGHASWRGEGLRAAAVLGAYYFFRRFVAAHDTPLAIDPSFYFANHYFPLGFLGLLALAPANALLFFGPLLALVGRLHAISRERWQRMALLAYVGGIVAILGVAHDLVRFVNFLFLPVLLGAVSLAATARGKIALAALGAAQVVVWTVVHPRLAEAAARHMHECGALTANPNDLPKLATCVVPRLWPWLAAAVGVLAGLLYAGSRRGPVAAGAAAGSTPPP